MRSLELCRLFLLQFIFVVGSVGGQETRPQDDPSILAAAEKIQCVAYLPTENPNSDSGSFRVQVNYSPDGQYLSVARRETFYIFDRKKSQLHAKIKTPNFKEVHFLQQGKIAMGTVDDVEPPEPRVLIDLASGKLAGEIDLGEHGNYATCVAPDGKTFLTAGQMLTDDPSKIVQKVTTDLGFTRPEIFVWDATTHEVIKKNFPKVPAFGPSIQPLAGLDDFIVAGMGDGPFLVNGQTLAMKSNLRVPGGINFPSSCVSPNEKHVIGPRGSYLHVIDVISGKDLGKLEYDKNMVYKDWTFSPDGKLFVAVGASLDKELAHFPKIIVWSTASRKIIARLTHENEAGEKGDIHKIEFCPDGSHFVTANWDEYLVRVWDTTAFVDVAEKPFPAFAKRPEVWVDPYKPVGESVHTSDPPELSPEEDEMLKKEVAPYKQLPIGNYKNDSYEHYCRLGYSPDGKHLIANRQGTFFVFDQRNYKPRAMGAGNDLVAMNFFDNGKMLFGSNDSGEACPIIDVKSGGQVSQADLGDRNGFAVSICPDGKTFVTVGFVDVENERVPEVAVWDIKKGAMLRKQTFPRLLSIGNTIEFHPTHLDWMMVSAGSECQIFDIKNMTLVRSLAGGGQNVYFTPDGKRVLSKGYKGLFLMDYNTGKRFGPFEVQAEMDAKDAGYIQYHDFEFSPDGNLLVGVGISSIREGTESIENPYLAVWSVRSQKIITSFFNDQSLGTKQPIQTVTFHPDGIQFATSTREEDAIRIWDTTEFVDLEALKLAKKEKGKKPRRSKKVVKDKPPTEEEPTAEEPADKPKPADPVTPKEQSARTWTSAKGSFKILATLVSQTDDAVKLKQANGKTISVPRKKLSAKDNKYLDEHGLK